ncbi:chemotaxis protein CheW [Corallococcus praedator]|uniref:Chemotaxis protein CheW n=1 Tax=Corallococcus praedator TaxID=2316724 RepID=A0ABX9QEA6_9BACT|nr:MULTISPECIES: chemotaxis protein CheW [Corallococcus]RKH12965.1 chemotaxis protein CheW [Corallococcus sp. CA047B]RKH24836.1 chemotaxis protein CheW [Corallococcus sp. CA031C]RKI00982.1 chemotaxis protein CheW [Corallococcus praedator]
MNQPIEPGSGGRSSYLSFMLAGEEYAVGLLRVREIIEYRPVTRVPGMPAAVQGVINLRGSVVPVVDLAVKFGLPARPITRWSCFVIVEVSLDGQQTVLGLLCDTVREVLELGADDIEPPPAFGTRVRLEFLRGMGRHGDTFILLLDLDRLLSLEELLRLTTAAEELPAAAPVAAPAPLPEAPGNR